MNIRLSHAREVFGEGCWFGHARLKKVAQNHVAQLDRYFHF